VRCLNQTTRASVLRRIKDTAEGVAGALGARCEVRIDPSYDPVVNDEAMVDLVRANAEALLGEGAAVTFRQPLMGVEDFGYYLTEIPGAFYSLGVRNESKGIVHPVHTGLFDIDESAMANGVALQVLNAIRVVGRC
jgi:amidohydrolase